MRFLIALIVIAAIAYFGMNSQQEVSDRGDIRYAYCNDRANGELSEYAMCRCLRLNNTVQYNREVDACMTNPTVYAEGFDGEIPERIRSQL
ncbi:MAG: hypothetical protein GKR91_12200 [Pseudomonadales bacterium]|nr:hypothetical protein [Pseudomonadales bacterium]